MGSLVNISACLQKEILQEKKLFGIEITIQFCWVILEYIEPYLANGWMDGWTHGQTDGHAAG